MKKLYLIPGYKHHINTVWYQELIKKLQSIWYKVVCIKIKWRYRVMSDYITQAKNQIQASSEDVILGFSFGAMIALRVAEEQKCKKVVLCSLSPYFSEDLTTASKYTLFRLGIRRWRDFSKNYSQECITNSLDNLFVIIYWTAETENLQRRNKQMKEMLSIQNVWLVDWVGHDIAHNDYQKMILKYIK